MTNKTPSVHFSLPAAFYPETSLEYALRSSSNKPTDSPFNTFSQEDEIMFALLGKYHEDEVMFVVCNCTLEGT
jgi:hypothetical protein